MTFWPIGSYARNIDLIETHNFAKGGNWLSVIDSLLSVTKSMHKADPSSGTIKLVKCIQGVEWRRLNFFSISNAGFIERIFHIFALLHVKYE